MGQNNDNKLRDFWYIGAPKDPASMTLVQKVSARVAQVFGFKSLRGTGGGAAAHPSSAEAGSKDFLGSTQAGSMTTSSPSFAQAERVALSYERRAIIADLWQLFFDDPRFSAGAWMRARKAVGGGFVPIIKARNGSGARVAKRAQQEAEDLLRRLNIVKSNGKVNRELLASWALPMLIEGDLFTQRVVKRDPVTGDDVVRVVRMPGATMERLTDNADNFNDATRAFAQVDVNTTQAHTFFALWQIDHQKWAHVDGDRYGSSAFLSARAPGRSLEIVEKSQEVRRITRSAPVRHHKVGTPEEPGVWDTDIKEYKENNGVNEGMAQIATDPYRQIKDYVSNGLVDIEQLDADGNVHQIDDLSYFRDLFNLSIGAPLAGKGYALDGMQRDTLQLVLTQWLEEDEMIRDVIYAVIVELICFQLSLKDIDPETLVITLAAPPRSLDTPSDTMKFIKDCMSNTIGAGMSAKPAPLMTRRMALVMLKDVLGITDVEAAEAEIDTYMEENSVDPDSVQEMAEMQAQGGGGVQGVGNGAANSKNSSGGATTGYGERFEGGKPKSSQDKKPGEGYKAK